MTSMKRTATEAARELNASDPLVVGFPGFGGNGEDPDYFVGDLVGILQGPLRKGEPRRARVQVNSEFRADFDVRELLWDLQPNGDGTFSTVPS